MNTKRTKHIPLFANLFWVLVLCAAPTISFGQAPHAKRPAFGLAYFNRSAVCKALGKGFEAQADFNRNLTMRENPTTPLPLERIKADKP